MDTFLTLVIALGGIATGIGAIWTAMLGRRQLSEQRRFLKEQNEIARSQARLTEQSLAEQNERTRLNLALEHQSRLMDRSESPQFMGRRRLAAKFLLEHAFDDDEIVALRQLHPALAEVGNFFEHMGYYHRLEVLPSEAVETILGWDHRPARLLRAEAQLSYRGLSRRVRGHKTLPVGLSRRGISAEDLAATLLKDLAGVEARGSQRYKSLVGGDIRRAKRLIGGR